MQYHTNCNIINRIIRYYEDNIFMKKKNKKSNLTGLEKFGIISAFVCSSLSIIFNVGEFIYNDIRQKNESVIILEGDETNYIFDGENLYKNICFAIANHSDINTSIVEINMKIDGENYSFNSVDNNICPINIASSQTFQSNISIPITINEADKEFILNKYGENFDIDVYELEAYFKYGKDMQNIYNIDYSPEIEIKLKTSKGNEIKFYKAEYMDYENIYEYALDEANRSWEKLVEK